MNDRLAEIGSSAPSVFDIVHAPLLLSYREVVAECSGDADALLRMAGMQGFAPEVDSLDYTRLAHLLELTAQALGRSDFGMLLALRQCGKGIEGALGHAMRHAVRFDEMLALSVEHGYAHSLASNSWLHHSPSGVWVMLGHDIVCEGTVAAGQLMEQILLIGHLTAIRLTGGGARSRRILLRHSPLSAPQVYRRYFGCEVRFDERVYATLYRAQDMSCRIVSADPTALREHIAAIEQRFPNKQLPLSRRVRGAILHALEEGHCTAEWVAGQLDLHVRNLHRHLAREGTSFRRIKDELRRDLAGYYLCGTSLDIGSISKRLGFSEQSALSRRAQAWFHRSPREVRAHRPDHESVSDRVKS
jgi:AraC-like DNA-binding protein